MYLFKLTNRLNPKIHLLMKTIPNVFSNADITVTYNPCECINAERCAKELSNVFRQTVIPWIDLDFAERRDEALGTLSMRANKWTLSHRKHR